VPDRNLIVYKSHYRKSELRELIVSCVPLMAR
jgi:hypothetical protein